MGRSRIETEIVDSSRLAAFGRLETGLESGSVSSGSWKVSFKDEHIV